MTTPPFAVPGASLHQVNFFGPGGVPVSGPIDLYPEVFDPEDPWGELFRRALSRLEWAGRHVADLGAGSGACAIQICRSGPPASLHLVEMVPRFAELARHNVVSHASTRAPDTILGVESCNAVAFLDQATSRGLMFDCIVGCLPQVPGTPSELRDPAAVAHLYDVKRHPAFPEWGLGLLYDVKVAARGLFARGGGRLILVHSGRVPVRARIELDARAGYREIRVVDETMVRHHPGTPLGYLFGEGRGFLFADPEGSESITPEQAEHCRALFAQGGIAEADYRVYHRLHVVESEAVW